MAPRLRWHGDQFRKYTKRAIRNGLAAASLDLQDITREMVGIPNPGVVLQLKGRGNTKRKAGSRVAIYVPGVGWRMSRNRRKRGGFVNRTQITYYPHSSRPGEPVHARTGVGQDDVVQGLRSDGMEARVGYTKRARYMIFHELGITYPRSGHQVRPALVPALQNNLGRVADVFRAAAQSTSTA